MLIDDKIAKKEGGEMGTMDELDNVITLNDESGQECHFEFLDLLEYQGDEFVVLLSTDEPNDEPGEVVILKVEESEDSNEENYVGVEDQEVLSAVFELFKVKFKDEFDFADE